MASKLELDPNILAPARPSHHKLERRYRHENRNYRLWKHRISREDVIISERNLAKAEQLATKLGSKAEAITIEDALEAADLVILAIWFGAMKDLSPRITAPSQENSSLILRIR
jgi:hypothetical protein